MSAIATLKNAVNNGKSLFTKTKHSAPYMAIGLLASIGVMHAAQAVGSLDASADGQALRLAYDAVNDLTGGYGKALVMTVGFIATTFGVLAAQATGPLLKFIGISIFASMGLAASFTLAGSLI